MEYQDHFEPLLKEVIERLGDLQETTAQNRERLAELQSDSKYVRERLDKLAEALGPWPD